MSDKSETHTPICAKAGGGSRRTFRVLTLGLLQLNCFSDIGFPAVWFLNDLGPPKLLQDALLRPHGKNKAKQKPTTSNKCHRSVCVAAKSGPSKGAITAIITDK